MPRKCYILRCDSNSNKSSKYTPIFSFPKEKERRTLWIAAVREQYPEIGDQDPGINASVCIHHFDANLVERHITVVRFRVLCYRISCDKVLFLFLLIYI